MMTQRTKVAILALMPVLAAELWLGGSWLKRKLAPAPAPLRASGRNEDAAPTPEPAVSLLLNGREDPAIASGGPLWISVSVTHRHAVNIASKIVLLRARAGRLSARKQPDTSLNAIRASISALEAASRLGIGSAAQAWTQAVQVTLRPLSGGDPAPWPLRTLSSRGPAAAVLDNETSVELHAAPTTPPAPGEYEVRACLLKTGAWQGTACSEPARLIVAAAPQDLTPAQREALDRDAVQLAFLSSDWPELERRGRALLDRDKLAGRLALGDALYGQQKWEQALAEYSAARALWPPNRGDLPRALNLRITLLLQKLGAEN